MSEDNMKGLLNTFLNDIQRIIPDLKESCLDIENDMNVNINSTIQDILLVLYKNEKNIYNKNEHVFESDILPKLNISRYWNDLDDKNKNIIWEYLKTLIIFGKKHITNKYNNKRDDEKDISGTTNIDINNDLVKSNIENCLYDIYNKMLINTLHTDCDTVETNVRDSSNNNGYIDNMINYIKHDMSLSADNSSLHEDSKSNIDTFMKQSDEISKNLYMTIKNKDKAEKELYINECIKYIHSFKDKMPKDSYEMKLLRTFLNRKGSLRIPGLEDL